MYFKSCYPMQYRRETDSAVCRFAVEDFPGAVFSAAARVLGEWP